MSHAGYPFDDVAEAPNRRLRTIGKVLLEVGHGF